MRGRGRWWPTTAVPLLMVLGACGSEGDESAIVDPAVDHGYCTQIDSLMSVFDRGGSLSDYDAALSRVVDTGPADHRPAWNLLLTLSREPFDYANFNPAVDALDDIWADLETACPGVDGMVVDDDGRIRHMRPD